MEYIGFLVGLLLTYLATQWIFNVAYETNSNNIENSKNKYANYENPKEQIPYTENDTFKVKIIKIEDANSNHLSQIFLIIGVKTKPDWFYKLTITQLDKNKNIINFTEKIIENEELRYNENENRNLFSKYTPETIPKFYTTKIKLYIDDCNITEYFHYELSSSISK